MAAPVSNNWAATGVATPTTLTLSSYQVSTGSNLLLVVGTSAKDTGTGSAGATRPQSITWGGTSLTKIVAQSCTQEGGQEQGASLYGLVAPTPGIGDVVVTWSESMAVGGALFATYLTGAEQVLPSTFTSANSSTSDAVSSGITLSASAIESLLIDCHSLSGPSGGGYAVSGTNQISRVNRADGGTPFTYLLASEITTTALGNTQFTWAAPGGWGRKASVVAAFQSAGGTTTATNTKSVSLDAVLFKSGNTKTTSLDALLNKTVTKTASLDALLNKTVTKTVSLDALLNKTTTKSVSFDSLLKKTATKTLGLDAVLTLGTATNTKSVSFNALLNKTVTKTASLDALINKTVTKTVSLDALLNKSNTKTVGLDAVISAIQTSTVTKSVGFDARLTSSRNTLAVGFDAFISAIQSTATSQLTIGLDAILFEWNGEPDSSDVWAEADAVTVPFWNTSPDANDGFWDRPETATSLTTNTFTLGFDAVIAAGSGTQHLANSVFFDALLIPQIGLSVGFDALTQLAVPATGADAVLVPEVTGGTRLTKSVGFDAVLQSQVPSVGADAVLV